MKRLTLLFSVLLTLSIPAFAQRTDLSGLKFCIDPGHGGHNSDDRHVIPDPGIDFWESESNFQKALLLKSLLEQQGAWVIMTRTSNDTIYPGGDDEPSLAARVQLANDNAVDWFHSIHSNAFNGATNYTLLLVREKRSLTDPAASTGNGLGIPEQQASLDVSATYIAPGIYSKLRTTSYMTYLDWTFYGGVNGGFSLGVLRGLLMPGELSEGSFHDYLPETRRLMNNQYHKMEAYAIRNAFMQYFGVPPDPSGIIAGIQRDIATQVPVNNTRVRLLPDDVVCSGDQYNNGFYMFDGVSAGAHTVRFETPGFATDSVIVSVGTGATVFVDRSLVSTGFPAVTLSTPANNDTAFPASQVLRFVFSTVMDTASVRSALSITPPVQGKLSWSNNNTVCTFDPDTLLPTFVNFTLTIDTSAHAVSGKPLDGNGDGTPGDPFVLHFKTIFVDVFPPFLTDITPDSIRGLASPGGVVTMTFNEPVNPTTVTTSTFALQQIGGGLISRTLQTFQAGKRSGVTMFPTGGLKAGTSYRVRVSGVQDTAGNAIPSQSPVIWSFSVDAGVYTSTPVDSLDGSVSGWKQPLSDPNSSGLDSATFAYSNSPTLPFIAADQGSGILRYVWNPGASSWLLSESIDSLRVIAGPQWSKNGSVVRAYLLGDGSGAQFRFVVDDSTEAFPPGDPQHQEVSSWMPIDWIGWKMAEWDLDRDSVGSWTGNGLLEGELRFSGFQLRYVPGVSQSSGTLAVDQIEVVKRQPVSVSGGEPSRPGTLELYPAYPNPFNPSTQIRYELPNAGRVSLDVYDLLGRDVVSLVSSDETAGRHEVTWNAKNAEGASVASGVYFARLRFVSQPGGSGYVRIIKLILTR